MARVDRRRAQRARAASPAASPQREPAEHRGHDVLPAHAAPRQVDVRVARRLLRAWASCSSASARTGGTGVGEMFRGGGGSGGDALGDRRARARGRGPGGRGRAARARDGAAARRARQTSRSSRWSATRLARPTRTRCASSPASTWRGQRAAARAQQAQLQAASSRAASSYEPLQLRQRPGGRSEPDRRRRPGPGEPHHQRRAHAVAAVDGGGVDAYRVGGGAPDDPAIQIELGQTAQNAGDVATAITAYERFLELAPDDPLAVGVQRPAQAAAAEPGGTSAVGLDCTRRRAGPCGTSYGDTGGPTHELRHHDRAAQRHAVRHLARRRGRPLHGARVQAAAPGGDRQGGAGRHRRLQRHDVHRLDHARRARRRREAAAARTTDSCRSCAATGTSPRSSRSPASTASSRSTRLARRPWWGRLHRLVRRTVLLLAAAAALARGRLRLRRASGSGQQPRTARRSSRRSAASCHTLAAAGTNGQVGPNLDEAFYQSKLTASARRGSGRRQGPDRVPDHGTVTGAPGMPADARDRATRGATNEPQGSSRLYRRPRRRRVVPGGGLRRRGASAGTDTGGTTKGGGAASRRRDDLRVRRLRQLPHARGGERDRQRSGRTSTRRSRPRSSPSSASRTAWARCPRSRDVSPRPRSTPWRNTSSRGRRLAAGRATRRTVRRCGPRPRPGDPRRHADRHLEALARAA